MDPNYLMVVAKGETVVEPRRKRILVAVVCAFLSKRLALALAAETVIGRIAVPGWPKSGCRDGGLALFVVLVDDSSCSSCYCYCYCYCCNAPSYCEAKGYWR